MQIILIILFVLIGVLYLPFLGNAFISDDIPGIVESLPKFTWASALVWPRIMEIGWQMQFLLYKLFGMSPWPFRLVNILFHCGSVVLVYAIVRRLTKPTIALAASLLFAVHPIIVESVTWISGGWYVWSGFLFLLSFWLYISFEKHRKTGVYILSFLAFSLSILISIKSVSLLALFLVYEWVCGTLARNWKRLIPFCIVSIGFAFFLSTLIQGRIATVSATSYQSFSELHNPFLQFPFAVSSYLWLLFWPERLTLYHAAFSMNTVSHMLRTGVTLCYLIVLAVALWKRKQVGLWLSWFLIALAPVLTPLKINWIVAERYAYLATVSWCVVMGMVFDRLLSSKKWKVPVYIIGVVIFLALSTRTIIRNSEWRNGDTLWLATVKRSPEAQNSWNNLGNVYSRHGEYEKSIEAFTQATRINPNYADAYHNIGSSYVQMKKYEEAIPFFEKALYINPNLWQSYQNLGFIAVANKEYPKAIEYFEKALTINPQEVAVWTNAAVLYLETGNKDKARDAVEQAIALDPGDVQARNLQKRLQ